MKTFSIKTRVFGQNTEILISMAHSSIGGKIYVNLCFNVLKFNSFNSFYNVFLRNICFQFERAIIYIFHL